MRLRERIQDRRIRRKKRRGEKASTPRGRMLDAGSTVKVEKEAPAFTKVERQPKSNVKPPKSDMKTDMSEGRSNVSADRGTGTGLPRTIGSARKQAEAQGTKAKTFMSKSGKAKAAVTAEELAKFRKKAGNTNLTYRGALRKFINERDGLTPKKPYETKKKVAKKAGGMMKAKGMKAGGKMKTKGYMAGGKMKTKGYKKGGKVKKLRGAGIERRGYRPIKMR